MQEDLAADPVTTVSAWEAIVDMLSATSMLATATVLAIWEQGGDG